MGHDRWCRSHRLTTSEKPQPSETSTDDDKIDWEHIPGGGPTREEKQRRRTIVQIFAAADGPLSEDEGLEQAKAQGVPRRDTLLVLGELKADQEIGVNRYVDWYASTY